MIILCSLLLTTFVIILGINFYSMKRENDVYDETIRVVLLEEDLAKESNIKSILKKDMDEFSTVNIELYQPKGSKHVKFNDDILIHKIDTRADGNIPVYTITEAGEMSSEYFDVSSNITFDKNQKSSAVNTTDSKSLSRFEEKKELKHLNDNIKNTLDENIVCSNEKVKQSSGTDENDEKKNKNSRSDSKSTCKPEDYHLTKDSKSDSKSTCKLEKHHLTKDSKSDCESFSKQEDQYLTKDCKSDCEHSSKPEDYHLTKDCKSDCESSSKLEKHHLTKDSKSDYEHFSKPEYYYLTKDSKPDCEHSSKQEDQHLTKDSKLDSKEDDKDTTELAADNSIKSDMEENKETSKSDGKENDIKKSDKIEETICSNDKKTIKSDNSAKLDNDKSNDIEDNKKDELSNSANKPETKADSKNKENKNKNHLYLKTLFTKQSNIDMSSSNTQEVTNKIPVESNDKTDIHSSNTEPEKTYEYFVVSNEPLNIEQLEANNPQIETVNDFN